MSTQTEQKIGRLSKSAYTLWQAHTCIRDNQGIRHGGTKPESTPASEPAAKQEENCRVCCAVILLGIASTIGTAIYLLAF